MVFENKLIAKEIISNYLKNIEKCLIKFEEKSNSSTINILIDNIKQNIYDMQLNIKDLEKPFILFIMGPGKNGKSTLINAMLRKDYTKTSTLPITWKVDSFIKSQKQGVIVVNQNFSEEFMEFDRAYKIIQIEEEKRKESETYINKKVQSLKESGISDILKLKEYKAKLKKEQSYNPNILETKHLLNSDGIIDDFIIVDTPGLNQVLLGNTQARIREYYEKANGVLWILDAQNISSKSCFDMIQNIQKIYNSSQQSRMIGVINKSDIIIQNHGIEKLTEVINEAKKIYKDVFTDIIAISSKYAYQGVISQNEELINKSNINSLYKSIDVNFKEFSEKIQIQSKIANLRVFKDNIIEEINSYKRSLYENIFKNDSKKKIAKEKVDLTKENLYNKINSFFKEKYYINSVNIIEYKVDLKRLEKKINEYIKELKCSLTNLLDINEEILDFNIKIGSLKNLNNENINNYDKQIYKYLKQEINYILEKIYQIVCELIDENHINKYIESVYLYEHIDDIEKLIKVINLKLGG